MVLCSKSTDSEEDIAGVQKINIAMGSMDNSCGEDPNLIKQGAEDAAKSLLQAAEDKIRCSSDLPRLLDVLHDLLYPVCPRSCNLLQFTMKS